MTLTAQQRIDTEAMIRTESDKRAYELGYWFDVDAAAHVCEFFERYLYHTMGIHAGNRFSLLDWQRNEIMAPLFGWRKPDGTRRFSKGDVFVAKKQGKALAVDTPIATPAGWTTMGELSPGDQVFDDNGLPCNVVAVTEVQKGRPCYEVTFTDGETIVADAEHEWCVHPRWRKPAILTTKQMTGRTWIDCKGSEGRRYAVSIAGALTLDDADLPIDPYTLGAWLGDGHSATNRLTCAESDAEIVLQIANAGYLVRSHRYQSKPGILTTTIGLKNGESESLIVALRDTGLINNKHIPREYFRGSYSQRLSLMQGMMDTDGHVGKCGQCEFTSTKLRLADGFMELAYSLGMKPRMTIGRATIAGRDCGPKYRIQFYSYQDDPCVSLQRKVARLKPTPERATRARRRHIASIAPCASVPVKCIQVDSPSRLFLCGETLIPTHNSTLAAGLACYYLVTGGQRAEIYGVAHTREQAGIIYREAAAMARTSPQLSERLKPVDSQKRVVYRGTGSFYAALAGEACSRGVEGINPNLVIIDEIHVQRSRELYDGLAYASAARPNSLMLSVSTVGVADQTTIWWEQYQYAKGVIDGTLIDPHRFAYVAQADPDCADDWAKCGRVEEWRKAMPSLGHTVSEDKIQDAYNEASNSPSKQNAFKRYLLNIPTAQVEKVVPIENWKACESPEPELAGRKCYGGLDMASSEDLTAFVLYFPADDDNSAYVVSWFWCPEDKIADRERKQLAHYRQWVDDGYLNETSGARIDHSEIERAIRDICDAYNVQEIGFDPWNADAVVNPLLEDEYPVTQVSQSMNAMTAGTQGILDEISEKRLHHDGNRVLTWCLANCAADQRDDGIKFSKGKSADKIDGAVALAMAKGRALAGVEDVAPMIF